MILHSKDGRCPHRAAGFTLIEMLVVVAVTGLAIGIAASFVPRRNARMELANAADLVADGLRGARVRALASGTPVVVSVAPDGMGLRVDGALRTLPGGVVLVGPAIRFAPDGSATAARLQLSSTVAALRLRIVVDWLTGRVTVANAA